MNTRVFDETELDQARQQAKSYPFVLVRELSQIWLGETQEANINWGEATELRFFSEQSELRFFGGAGRLRAVLLEDGDEADSLHQDRTFSLAHKRYFGKSLTIREHFGYDEDGQLFVRASRLKGWVK